MTDEQQPNHNAMHEPASVAGTTGTRSKAGRWIALLAWPVFCAIAAAGYVQLRVDEIEHQLASRPPIAVLDVNHGAMALLKENPKMSGEDAARAMYAKGERLAKAGYVVLHKNDLVAYPAEYEVRQ